LVKITIPGNGILSVKQLLLLQKIKVSTPETVVVAEPVKEVSKSEEAVLNKKNRAVSTKKSIAIADQKRYRD
jgi:hypothetical protein